LVTVAARSRAGHTSDKKGDGPFTVLFAAKRLMTVLFADMVRSMDIATALDMERSREIMTEVVERAAAVVRRHGGTVEYYGDGLMALFGSPVALEDHAFRACLAEPAEAEVSDSMTPCSN
jgi:class 3 adenylate cyclase